jgi:hypothetical protein
MFHLTVCTSITKDFSQIMGDIIKGHAELKEAEILYPHLTATKRYAISRDLRTRMTEACAF